MGASMPDVQRHADDAFESVRAMSRVSDDRVLPAPFAHEVFGSLHDLALMLPQVFDQLSTSLYRALIELDTYESDGGSPIDRTAEARARLAEASTLAVQMGAALEGAQDAVSLQGHRPWAPRGRA